MIELNHIFAQIDAAARARGVLARGGFMRCKYTRSHAVVEVVVRVREPAAHSRCNGLR